MTILEMRRLTLVTELARARRDAIANLEKCITSLADGTSGFQLNVRNRRGEQKVVST